MDLAGRRGTTSSWLEAMSHRIHEAGTSKGGSGGVGWAGVLLAAHRGGDLGRLDVSDPGDVLDHVPWHWSWRKYV